MEKKYTTGWFKSYFKKHWFQVTLFALIIFVLFKKDFSFQFNLNDPNKLEEEQKSGQDNQPILKQASGKTKAMTENTSKGSAGKKSVSDYFNISFGSSKSKYATKRIDLNEIDTETKESFLKRFAHVALSERKKFGIPSSIILANAYLQSGSGKGAIAKGGNNYFSIPCKNTWQGASGTYYDACFRHYENAWTSFRDHSVFVTQGLGSKIRNLDSRDYKAWAKAIEGLNYSGINNLAKELIQIIEHFGLNELDHK